MPSCYGCAETALVGLQRKEACGTAARFAAGSSASHVTMATREFKVSDWKPTQKNTLQAVFTIETPNGLLLHDCTLHEKKGARWIALPARSDQKLYGSKAWQPIVDFRDRRTPDRFADQCVWALEAARYVQQ